MDTFAKISFMGDNMVVLFGTGKKRLYPLDEFPELLATDNDGRRKYEIMNQGKTARWDLLDFEIQTDRLLLSNNAG
jgi:hypothetical protein